MIKEEGKYYLYRHIRLDKNEPFYIGVGTKGKKHYNSPWMRYRRANTSNRRNPIWRKITAKTGYEIEILLESDDYDFILQKEIEFIKLYGRKDLGTGTLSNLTDGGEGVVGFKRSPMSEEGRERIRISRKKRSPHSEETKRRMSESKKGIRKNQESINKTLETRECLAKQEKIRQFLTECPNSPVGKTMQLFNTNYRIIKRIKEEMGITPIPIIRRIDGKEYASEASACRDMGVSRGCVQKCIEKNWKVKGFLFEYIKENYEGKNKKGSKK